MTTENTPPPDRQPPPVPPPTIADYDAAIERATDALWRLLPERVHGLGRDTVRRWADAVIEAAGAPPDECGPPVDPTTGPTYRVGTHHGVTINREGDGHRCGRPGHDCDRGHIVAVVVDGDWDLAERIVQLLNGPDGYTITGQVTVNAAATVRPYAAAQCPNCTSDRRDWRFTMPKSGLLRDAAPCSDPWHDQPHPCDAVAPEGERCERLPGHDNAGAGGGHLAIKGDELVRW